MDLVSSRYETESSLSEYLLFHYGKDQDIMPYHFGPVKSIGFPVRCVSECLDIDALPSQSSALELGCAVGRSSFELSRYCTKVVAVDRSEAFISAAKCMQQNGFLEYSISEEGVHRKTQLAKVPEGVHPDRVAFRCCDVMDLNQEQDRYHVVLAANLLCRLPDPKAFLSFLPKLVFPQGQLILTTPYSWLEEFTPRSRWLGAEESCSVYEEEKKNLEYIQNIIGEWFELVRYFDLPFLIREHVRKYQWGVAQASVWKRK